MAHSMFLAAETDERSLARDTEPAAAKRWAILAFLLMLVIAPVDYHFRGSYAMLYLVPVILLALHCSPSTLFKGTALAIGLIYGVYVLKAVFNPPPSVDTPIYGSRFVNRTFVALMLLWFTWMARVWDRWQSEQSDQTDPELPESFRNAERDNVTTLAVVCCVPLAALIALVDLLAPANINLSVLYPIAIFICGWTGNRILLWSMLVVLLVLSFAAYLFGPPSTVSAPDLEFGLMRDRLLAAYGLISATLAVHVWMNRKSRSQA